MRRKDREITDIDKIETIIASARYMHLGMFDGEFPYCTIALWLPNGKGKADILCALCERRTQVGVPQRKQECICRN